MSSKEAKFTKVEAIDYIAKLLNKADESIKEGALFDTITGISRDFTKIRVLDDLVHDEGWDFLGVTGIGQPLLNIAHQGLDESTADILWKVYDLLSEISWVMKSIDDKEWWKC